MEINSLGDNADDETSIDSGAARKMSVNLEAQSAGAPERVAAMCLGPASGSGFDLRRVPRRRLAPDEIEVVVEAASVNPIDVRRAEGYGHRLLSLMGAARFPMVLGNDFAGTVSATGGGGASTFAVGDRVYGVKPPSRDGSHASHVVAKAMHARKAPEDCELQDLAALPYSFVTMWLAAKAAGVTQQNAQGEKVLVHGASGGLGTLALQTLSAWGARVTAIAKASDTTACARAGAAEVIDREDDPFGRMRGAYDATLNFATWNDEFKLLSCLREGALGHATTVHPMVQTFDQQGWIGGALETIRQKRAARALLPNGVSNYGWVLFRPDNRALSEMARFAHLRRLSLPIGVALPLEKAGEAFDRVRRHLPGRTLLIP